MFITPALLSLDHFRAHYKISTMQPPSLNFHNYFPHGNVEKILFTTILVMVLLHPMFQFCFLYEFVSHKLHISLITTTGWIILHEFDIKMHAKTENIVTFSSYCMHKHYCLRHGTIYNFLHVNSSVVFDFRVLLSFSHLTWPGIPLLVASTSWAGMDTNTQVSLPCPRLMFYMDHHMLSILLMSLSDISTIKVNFNCLSMTIKALWHFIFLTQRQQS